MDVRRAIGTNIKRFRLAADLSQEAVAERMGVDRAYVSGLERGERNPTVVTLWHVAQALGVEIPMLFDDFDSAGVDAPKPSRKRATKRS